MKTEQIKDAYGEAYNESVIDAKGWTYYINDGMMVAGMKPAGHYEIEHVPQDGRIMWRPIALTIIEAKGNITAGGEVAIEERRRQVEDLGYDYTNNELYADEQLAKAGACYALTVQARSAYQSFHTRTSKWFPRWWPWSIDYWKPTPDDRIKELGKAAALIIAQIDYYLNKKK